MKNLKNLLAAVTLLAVLVLGTTSANAGLLMSDRSVANNPDPCAGQSDTKVDTDLGEITGIIIAGLTGIIIAGRDGIIIAGKAGNGGQVNCGIILTD